MFTTRFLHCSVLVALLVGQTQAIPLKLPHQVPLPGAPKIKTMPLTDVFNRTITTPNCLTSAFETPGQAWHIGLTGGGITLNAAQYGIQAKPATFQQVYGFSPTWVGQKKAAGEILIIDHFKFVPVKIMGRKGQETLELSHGALVEAHLRSLLESAGFVRVSTQMAEGILYQRGSRTIRLRRMDLKGEIYRSKAASTSVSGSADVTSQQLSQELEEQLGGFIKDVGGATDLVLNMSFSMIPCQVFAAYRENRDAWAQATPAKRYTFNAFVGDVARANKVTLATVERELTTVSDKDPLRVFLAKQFKQKLGQGRHLSAVASSGNFGLPYSTAPGSFSNVISVGAVKWNGQPAGQTGDGDWSDRADAYAPGEWLTLSGEQLQRYCREGGTCITKDLQSASSRYRSFGYRGTSFTAPTVSLFLALQQQPANACFTSQGTGYRLLNKRTAQAKVGKSDFAQMWKTCERPAGR